MDFVIGLILSLVAPKAPAYVKQIVTSAIPLLFELAQDITEMIRKSNLDKTDVAAIAATVRSLLDESLDTLPGWSEMSEEDRDTVLDALEILTVWIADLADKDDDNKVTPAQLKAAAVKVKRGFRRATLNRAALKKLGKTGE